MKITIIINNDRSEKVQECSLENQEHIEQSHYTHNLDRTKEKLISQFRLNQFEMLLIFCLKLFAKGCTLLIALFIVFIRACWNSDRR